MAGVRSYRDLIAWQLADAFKNQVFGLVTASARAADNRRYRDQLLDAAGAVSKDIAEGFLRNSRRDFSRFLDYALGSLGEAEERLADGVSLGYFEQEHCRAAFRYAKRCMVATIRLKQSQRRGDIGF